MTVFINGEAREIAAADVAALVEELALDAPVTLVEHNGLALRRDEWNARALCEGDRVELLRVVAGG